MQHFGKSNRFGVPAPKSSAIPNFAKPGERSCAYFRPSWGICQERKAAGCGRESPTGDQDGTSNKRISGTRQETGGMRENQSGTEEKPGSGEFLSRAVWRNYWTAVSRSSCSSMASMPELPGIWLFPGTISRHSLSQWAALTNAATSAVAVTRSSSPWRIT